MAQRWPSASRSARDDRKSCASARGAPAVSASEACYPTRASPLAQRGCCCCARCTVKHRTLNNNLEQTEDSGDDDDARDDDRAERGRVE
eukprot:6237746-Prymnesium_polylepis.1